MADQDTPLAPFLQNIVGGGGAGLQDLSTNGKNLNTTLSLLITTLQQIFPRVFGTFTLSAAASTIVTNVSITTDSYVFPFPINASAGTLQGSVKSLYHDRASNVDGASFTVKTANAASAAGTELFAYFVINPA